MINNERNYMGSKAKSVYLSIYPRGSLKRVFTKMFFDAKSYNEYIKGEEFLKTYPKEEFEYVKEVM